MCLRARLRLCTNVYVFARARMCVCEKYECTCVLRNIGAAVCAYENTQIDRCMQTCTQTQIHINLFLRICIIHKCTFIKIQHYFLNNWNQDAQCPCTFSFPFSLRIVTTIQQMLHILKCNLIFLVIKNA